MKPSTLAELTNRKTLLVLAYAPAGLGHLRVTDALYHGLPETVNPVVLGSQDTSIQQIHRLTSVNPVGKAVFDWLQAGPYSEQSNKLYRDSLRASHRDIYEDMTRLLAERLERPEKILVACTHFGLAHKLAAIKKELQQREHIRMVLAVCVTDDTFQHIWYVDGADLLVVPSEQTKRKYVEYGQRMGNMPRIEVVPYPVHPRLSVKLTQAELKSKSCQVDPHGAEPIHVSIPISGAAVGTPYFSALMAALRQQSDRFIFHIVCKDAPFTQDFLAELRDKAWIEVRAGKDDREVVNSYDTLIDTQTLAFEVTKPSEQTFKCLVGTGERGGVILLFTQPVGSQEFDNMNFLERHSLVPSSQTNDQLWAMSADESRIDPALFGRLLDEAGQWRGVRIPGSPQHAARFIWWMQASGLFSRMMAGNLERVVQDEASRALGPDGVAQFWDLAASV